MDKNDLSSLKESFYGACRICLINLILKLLVLQKFYEKSLTLSKNMNIFECFCYDTFQSFDIKIDQLIFILLCFRRPVPNAPPQIPKRPAVPGGKPDLSSYYANTDQSLL